MRIIKFARIIYPITIFFIVGGCTKDPVPDPCLQTKWSQPKEFEIKLAVHVLPSNPNLPGGTTGSQNPVDFDKMIITGTLEKIECSEQKSGFANLGNSYVNRSVDLPAPIEMSQSWWIGHVVYVYEFGNDNDHLNVNLSVKITMKDNQSYSCKVMGDFYSKKIIKTPGEMYYYILLEIYSDNWVKV
jgi:hypothetical protein